MDSDDFHFQLWGVGGGAMGATCALITGVRCWSQTNEILELCLIVVLL